MVVQLLGRLFVTPSMPVSSVLHYALEFAQFTSIDSVVLSIWRNDSRKNEERATMEKQLPFLDGTGDGSKV